MRRDPAVAWDAGVSWRSVRTETPVGTLLDLTYVRDKVLRVRNDSTDDEFIERSIRVAEQAAEDDTGRALSLQTWAQYHDRFPCGPIVLDKLPLVSITSFSYVDPDGVTQQLAVSPPAYQLMPSSDWSRAELWPAWQETWPSTATQPDAVVVTYTAGYTAAATDPILELIKAGMQAMIGEFYSHRTLSVHEVRSAPTQLMLSRFWRQVP